MTPSLSIVIPSHRRADLLTLCLQSVVRHVPAGCEIEILVVDDGSPNAVVSRTAETFPGVRVLRRDTPAGFCAAANAGIEATDGDIVQLLNDDTQVFPDWARAALAGFDDPEVGAVAPLVLRGPTDGNDPRIDSAGDEYHAGGYARKRWHNRRLSSVRCEAIDVGAVGGSAGFYRRTALDQSGLFPVAFGAYFEDVDLSLRLRGCGWRMRHEPESRVWHAVGSSYGRPDRKLSIQQSRNEEWLFWRNLSRTRPAADVLRHALVLLGKGCLRLHDGQIFAWLRGRMRAWSKTAVDTPLRQMVRPPSTTSTCPVVIFDPTAR